MDLEGRYEIIPRPWRTSPGRKGSLIRDINIRHNLEGFYHLLLHKPCFPFGKKWLWSSGKTCRTENSIPESWSHFFIAVNFHRNLANWLIILGVYFIICKMKIKLHLLLTRVILLKMQIIGTILMNWIIIFERNVQESVVLWSTLSGNMCTVQILSSWKFCDSMRICRKSWAV